MIEAPLFSEKIAIDAPEQLKLIFKVYDFLLSPILSSKLPLQL